MDKSSPPTSKLIAIFFNKLVETPEPNRDRAQKLLFKLNLFRIHPGWNEYLYALVNYTIHNGFDFDALDAIAPPAGAPAVDPILIKDTSTVFKGPTTLH